MAIRFAIYGLLGWCIEIVFTALGRAVSGKGDRRLAGVTHLWMFPVYGLLAPLYEPAHDALRPRPWLLRGLLYIPAFMAIEYASGWLLRRSIGVCPWDYTGRCRWHLHGLTRLDYAPLWGVLGLAFEPVHDFLVRLTPAIRRALRG